MRTAETRQVRLSRPGMTGGAPGNRSRPERLSPRGEASRRRPGILCRNSFAGPHARPSSAPKPPAVSHFFSFFAVKRSSCPARFASVWVGFRPFACVGVRRADAVTTMSQVLPPPHGLTCAGSVGSLRASGQRGARARRARGVNEKPGRQVAMPLSGGIIPSPAS